MGETIVTLTVHGSQSSAELEALVDTGGDLFKNS